MGGAYLSLAFIPVSDPSSLVRFIIFIGWFVLMFSNRLQALVVLFPLFPVTSFLCLLSSNQFETMLYIPVPPRSLTVTGIIKHHSIAQIWLSENIWLSMQASSGFRHLVIRRSFLCSDI